MVGGKPAIFARTSSGRGKPLLECFAGELRDRLSFARREGRGPVPDIRATRKAICGEAAAEPDNDIDTETDDLLHEAWTTFRDDPEVRLAILTGTGGKAFCAGADLATHVDGWLDGGPDLGRTALTHGFAGGITREIRTNKPIIAALNGWVIGGGIELALACDIRVAADDISFSFFHMQHGTHFGDGGMVRLVNTCGVGIAMELELMGEPITAQRALECHLVNRLVPRADLMATVEDMAAKILRNPRRAVESVKETRESRHLDRAQGRPQRSAPPPHRRGTGRRARRCRDPAAAAAGTEDAWDEPAWTEPNAPR